MKPRQTGAFKSYLSLFLFWGVVTSLCSCNVQRLAVKQSGGIIERGLPVFFAEGDLELAQTALAANIKILETLLQTAPNDARLLLATSQALTAYSFGFAESDFEKYRFQEFERSKVAQERAKTFYWRAKEYAQRAMMTRRDCRPLVQQSGQSLKIYSQNLQKIRRESVPYLFWYAFAWGAYINLSKDDISAINDIAKVEVAMKRILDLEDDYFLGFGHLFLGIYYGSRPKMLGGDAKLSAEHFDRVDAINQKKMLLSQVFRAQYLAAQELDENQFHRLIGEVLNAPLDLYPEQALLNQLAKTRARDLQQNASKLF